MTNNAIKRFYAPVCACACPDERVKVSWYIEGGRHHNEFDPERYLHLNPCERILQWAADVAASKSSHIQDCVYLRLREHGVDTYTAQDIEDLCQDVCVRLMTDKRPRFKKVDGRPYLGLDRHISILAARAVQTWLVRPGADDECPEDIDAVHDHLTPDEVEDIYGELEEWYW